ncbi:MAG: class II aldolase/adducin family protein [Thermodesulfobacteriota bacterium]
MDEELKIRLEKAYKILSMEGLAEDTSRGHITLRTGDNRIYIKPWGIGFEEVTAESLLCLDSEGKLLEGKGKVHSEIPIHVEIFRKRRDVFSVVHVHPYHTILLSAVFNGTIKIIGHSGMHFMGKIPFYDSLDLIRSKEQAIELAKVMGDRSFVLMKNHGIVTAGRTLEEAIITAIDFEKAAKDHLTISSFKKVTEVPADLAEMMSKKLFIPEQYKMMWDYYCRKVERHH